MHSKIEQNVYRIHMYSPSPQRHIVINIPHQTGTFVTLDEPTQICQYHPESIVYIRVTLGVIHSLGFDKL